MVMSSSLWSSRMSARRLRSLPRSAASMFSPRRTAECCSYCLHCHVDIFWLAFLDGEHFLFRGWVLDWKGLLTYRLNEFIVDEEAGRDGDVLPVNAVSPCCHVARCSKLLPGAFLCYRIGTHEIGELLVLDH